MMTVKQIYDLAINLGMEKDPRGKNAVKKYLDKTKKDFYNLKEEEKEFFDQEKLTNPYTDTRFHTGDKSAKVKRVLAGIDITPAEIILATQLNERGRQIDLVISHHPIGLSLAGLQGTMDMLVDVYNNFGVPVHLAEKLMEERIKEVGRGILPINHYQIIDLANLLKVNLINTHTATDNLVADYLDKYIKAKNPERVGDLVQELTQIPEYKEAKKRGFGPKIFHGNTNNRVGKFMVDMTGGTSPSTEVYPQLSKAGVSSIVGMHMKDEAMEKASKSHMNVVIAGHISSDSLGMNLFLDELEAKGIEIVPCGGLIRISRVKKNKNKK